jgi:tRNA(fMet)-specific endonuclease VapC
VAEIRYGFAAGDVSVERREALEDFLALFQIDDFPALAADDYAVIRVRLERAGSKIGGYDMLIAAHARHIKATLVTNNEREFRRVPGLAVQNWLKP